MRVKFLMMVAMAAVAVGLPASGAPVDIPATAAKCDACHNSGNAEMPRLDGQNAPYLATRIRSFADLTRQNPHAYFMFDINQSLSDATVVGVAKYLAALPATEPAGGGKHAGRGEKLYRSGDGAAVPACQGCHGAHGEGGGEVPRIAGQRGAYLRAQLEDFSMFTRVHEGMNMNARRMTEDQINDLVAFLSRD